MPAAEQEGQQPLLASFLIAFGILPGPAQVPDGFILCHRNIHSGQFPGTMQTGQGRVSKK